MPGVPKPQRTLDQRKSNSVIVFYWGVRKEFGTLGLHNMFMSSDPWEEYGRIFQQNTIREDPTIYLNISSKMGRTDAPEGCENWFVMATVPTVSSLHSCVTRISRARSETSISVEGVCIQGRASHYAFCLRRSQPGLLVDDLS